MTNRSSSKGNDWAPRAVKKGSILVDTRGIFGESGDIIRFNHEDYDSVSSFLDDVYNELRQADSRILPYKYDVQWILKDETGQLRKDIGRKANNGERDERTLISVGILPESILHVEPASPNWATLRR
jgi:hypothetical protein